MKIALVTDTYRPQINGVVSSIDTIKNELEKEHEVYIFAPTKAKEAYSLRSFPFFPYSGYKIAVVRAKTLAKTFEKKDIDLVHVHTPFSLGASGVGAARHLHLPAVGTFHTMLPEYTHYLSKTLGLLLKKFGWKYVTWFYGRFNALTVPSRPIKKSLVERDLENVYVIPNAVDTDHFHPSEEPKNENPTILFVGRIGREKKLEDLIDSAVHVVNEYPKAEFRIIGKGPDKDWYKELVEKRNISDNFFFEGYVESPELLKAYQSCDVFAIPSDTETQGLVSLEAMACGKPVIGANALGLKDVITHEDDGYLFQPGNPDELANYLIKLLGNSKLRRKMGKNARKKAEQFSAERVGKKWIRFYSSLIK